MPDLDLSKYAEPDAKQPDLSAYAEPSAPKTRARFDAPITSGFDSLRDGGARVHHALDLGYGEGDPIAVNKPGRVIEVGEDPKSGKYVKIDHGDGFMSSYAHLQESGVK